MILVSACLAGFRCRYDGNVKSDERIIKLVKEGKAIPICPEQLSGLATPRKPVEIKNNKVLTKDNIDLTDKFMLGASETLKLCKSFNCTKAILKEKSPSCGVKKVYDGTFSGTLVDGMGMTARLLKENGIDVISADDY